MAGTEPINNTEQRYRIALEKIANFGHAKDCEHLCVPIYECCCFDKSQTQIAKEALNG